MSVAASPSRERRVLVVAYYFPPMGLSGVQRTAKFVKYLGDHGWRPTVLTVAPRGYFAFDAELLRELEDRDIEIVRTGSLDPTRLFGRREAVRFPGEGRRRVLAALSAAVFVPDNKIGWYPAAVRRGRRILETQRFDAVFSSAPPYSGHLVAARLARGAGLPLVVDFRDDWVGNPRHRYPTALHRALHARLERRVVRGADAVVSINAVIGAAIEERTGVRAEVIPQGFDPEDYGPPSAREPGDVLRLVYTGMFYDAQTPLPFLRGLRRLRAMRPEIRVQARFVGLFDHGDAVRELGLEDIVQVDPYRPHRDAMTAVSAADVAWMTVGRQEGEAQISTGKLYAYMGARKPILGLVPDGAAADALRAYGAAWVVPPDDEEAIAHAIVRIAGLRASGGLPAPDEACVAAHDRRALAGRLAALLARVVAPPTTS